MERQYTVDRHPAPRPSGPTGARINDLMAALVADLEADGVPSPLGQVFTLGIIWAELCRLAGEEPPPAVAGMLDEPVAA